METKEFILSEIRRLAQERDGRVGLKAFLKATGIPEKQILGKYWATWNEAVADAGIETASFLRPRTSDDSVLEALAHLVVHLKKWPSETELSLARRRDTSFPSLRVIRRLNAAGGLPAQLVAHCAGRPEFSSVEGIAAERLSQAPMDVTPYERAPIKGYVYMMRSGRRYKIGHTNSPARRHREVRLDLPDATKWVHSIETDDPKGIEVYWHRRFEAKRVRDTEFWPPMSLHSRGGDINDAL